MTWVPPTDTGRRELLARRVPDIQQWEHRGNGLYRGQPHSELLTGYVYVLFLSDRHVPHPIDLTLTLMGSYGSAEDATPSQPYDTIPGGIAALAVPSDLPDDAETHIRAELERDIEHQNLPECVVPRCGKKAPVVFIVAEPRGRLAGREWTSGDKIHVCPKHGNDIYRTQGVYGIDQLPDWVKPDAGLDPFDLFDAARDVLHGSQIAQDRARMLRLARPTPK